MVKLDKNTTCIISRSHDLVGANIYNFKGARIIVTQRHWPILNANYVQIWIKFAKFRN